MPRYVVERTFTDGHALPAVIQQNEFEGVTWLHSYVSDDRTKAFCVYDGPSPEAIRKTAADNHLPVDVITEVRMLDPYMYSREEK